jgi:hypothetical protein
VALGQCNPNCDYHHATWKWAPFAYCWNPSAYASATPWWIVYHDQNNHVCQLWASKVPPGKTANWQFYDFTASAIGTPEAQSDPVGIFDYASGYQFVTYVDSQGKVRQHYNPASGWYRLEVTAGCSGQATGTPAALCYLINSIGVIHTIGTGLAYANYLPSRYTSPRGSRPQGKYFIRQELIAGSASCNTTPQKVDVWQERVLPFPRGAAGRPPA